MAEAAAEAAVAEAAAEAAVAEAAAGLPSDAEVLAGALSEPAGALSEPDQGAATDPGAGEPGPDPQPDPQPEPEPPTGTAVIVDVAPEVPDSPAPAPQAPGVVQLANPAPLRTWAHLLCDDEAGARARGFDGCAGLLEAVMAPSLLGGCFYEPVKLGVGDRFRHVSPPESFDPPLGNGLAGLRLETVGEILGFSAPMGAADNLRPPWPGDGWSWVTARVRWAGTYLYDWADPAAGPEREAAEGSPFTGLMPEWWAQVGGEDNREIAPDGALASGLIAVKARACHDGAPSPC